MTAALLLAGGGSLHDRLERLVAGVLVGDDVLVGRGDPIGGGSPCQVAGCPRPMLPEGLCGPHRARWRSAGWPDIEYWDSGLPVPPIVVHLAGLPRAVQLEVAYGMHRARRDPNPPTMSVKSLQRLIRVLRTRRVESLADDGRTPVPTNGPFGGGRMHADAQAELFPAPGGATPWTLIPPAAVAPPSRRPTTARTSSSNLGQR